MPMRLGATRARSCAPKAIPGAPGLHGRQAGKAFAHPILGRDVPKGERLGGGIADRGRRQRAHRAPDRADRENGSRQFQRPRPLSTRLDGRVLVRTALGEQVGECLGGLFIAFKRSFNDVLGVREAAWKSLCLCAISTCAGCSQGGSAKRASMRRVPFIPKPFHNICRTFSQLCQPQPWPLRLAWRSHRSWGVIDP